MAIHFIPNDPMAGASSPMRRQTPARNRPRSRAGLNLHDPEPQGLHQPGSPEFLFWQCREAALQALSVWEKHSGQLTTWQGGRRRLDLIQNAVQQRGEAPQPNAFYDRTGFVFYEFTTGSKTTFSGASTDVVAHEVGHGLLDALRPDLWDAPFLEVNAFHEAFGDCMAILTALDDAPTRRALLAIGLDRKSFVETTAEDLSDAIRRFRPNHNAAAPRRAFNTLSWQLPPSLPATGGPGQLINESHSFAQVFTGCFWDVIRNLLGNATSNAALEAAARTAGELLVLGATGAPEDPRFFQAVGRAMVLGDEEENAGANRAAVRDAFAAHGIALGSNAMLAPVATLEGPAPTRRGGATLSPATRRDLRTRLGASAHARMTVRRRAIGGQSVTQAVHEREVPLGTLSPKLKGVVALAPEGVLVGGSGRRAAVLDRLPEASATTDEVRSYVESLLTHGRVDFGEGDRRRGAVVAARPATSWYSHAVRTVGGRKVLTRIRFACGG